MNKYDNMKKIEDEFQIIIDGLESGRMGSLTSDQYRCITRFWGLWHWRNHFIDSPLEDTPLNGIAGESLTLNQKEILESRWYSFAIGAGKIPARMMTGLQIQVAIDRYEMANGG